MTNQVEFAFVSALEREVSSLVRSWRSTSVTVGNRQRRVYHFDNAVLICAGTGVTPAYAAAKVLIEKFSPGMILSIGFAGACIPDLQPGAVLVPAEVVESDTGRGYPCAFGRGILATLHHVAGVGLKQCAAARFGALAVDMEAAGVAAAASESGLEFAAIKAISDGPEQDLGFLADFVTPEGFATGRFVTHMALRPGLWPAVAALNRNSKLAAVALKGAVAECIGNSRNFRAKHSPAVTEA
jgi:nucleoside phosphorylase